MIVDREWIDRENRRLSRLLRAAKLPMEAALEDVWCKPGRGLTKEQTRELATCQWLRAHHNVIVVGKTGCGKTYFAAALVQAVCRRGHRALYIRVPRLLHELMLALAVLGQAQGARQRMSRVDAKLCATVVGPAVPVTLFLTGRLRRRPPLPRACSRLVGGRPDASTSSRLQSPVRSPAPGDPRKPQTAVRSRRGGPYSENGPLGPFACRR